jgi:cytochrome c biogenesis protein CcdA/glutaredoxin
MIDKFVSGRLADAASKSAKTLEMQVFVKPGCKHCQEFEPVLNKIKAEYGNRLLIRKHDISDGNERILYAAYCNLYGSSESGVSTPAVFVSNSFVSGEEAVEKTGGIVENVFAGKQHELTRTPTAREIAAAETALMEQFKAVPFFTIIIAGLIDGINPCVFSTLVFFISLLSVSKIKHRKLLLAGCVYCLACYMTYFSMGLGILSLFNVINQFKSAGLIMNYTMIGLLAILIFFSLRDAYYFRKTGKAGAVTLQLPDYMKTKIHDLMRKGLRYRFLIPGAFFIGICVTLIESACTAQVYIPTLGIISKHGGMSAMVILYLALYNLMCIVPLITVFAFAYYGTTTNTFIRWTKNDLVAGKLLMSLLFILLAILLIFSIN